MRIFHFHKHQFRGIENEIRHVLLTVWDPIGIQDIPQCADEYDCCVPGVYKLLTKDHGDDEIADYLWRRATDHMGLTVSKEAMYPTVQALRRIRLG